MSKLVIKQKLDGGMFNVHRGTYDGKECVIKFYDEECYASNEFEILIEFQKHSLHPEWFPKPILSYIPKGGSKYRKVIIYEFIPGRDVDVDEITSLKSKALADSSFSSDIKAHLEEIHRMGFVHADAHLGNIIQNLEGRYLLIDYGLTYSVFDKRFPPTDLWEDEQIPTMNDDFYLFNL